MPIVPENKDWTWVLERPCPECGVDASAMTAQDAAALFRRTATAWAPVLARPDVRERPDEATWSPLEYACHVRDTLGVFAVRVRLMREHDGAELPDWDQDAAAVRGRYGEQDPGRVAGELEAALVAAAQTIEAVPQEQLARTGRRGDGAGFTIESLARYFAHDAAHHLHDVGGEA